MTNGQGALRRVEPLSTETTEELLDRLETRERNRESKHEAKTDGDNHFLKKLGYVPDTDACRRFVAGMIANAIMDFKKLAGMRIIEKGWTEEKAKKYRGGERFYAVRLAAKKELVHFFTHGAMGYWIQLAGLGVNPDMIRTSRRPCWSADILLRLGVNSRAGGQECPRSVLPVPSIDRTLRRPDGPDMNARWKVPFDFGPVTLSPSVRFDHIQALKAII
jgi:hypothetical protein